MKEYKIYRILLGEETAHSSDEKIIDFQSAKELLENKTVKKIVMKTVNKTVKRAVRKQKNKMLFSRNRGKRIKNEEYDKYSKSDDK